MTTSNLSSLSSLSQWVTEIDYGDLADGVKKKLRASILDGLGCALFGSTLPWSGIVRDVLAPGNAGAASIWGTPRRATPWDAALVNAVALHGFELDDFSSQSRGVHGASSTLPPVIAIAEASRSISGADAIVASAAGWATSIRVSRALGPQLVSLGWHPTAILSTVGAAASAGKAMHLSTEKMGHCLSLALLQASGLTIASEGGMGKRLYSGRAAHTGVTSAYLAMEGYTGPTRILDEAPGSFISAFRQENHENWVTLLSGELPVLTDDAISFKPYASCGAGHVAIDALRDMLKANPDITFEDVDAINVRVSPANTAIIGSPYEPKDTQAAQFSLPYCLAVLLLEGNVSVHQFRDELLDHITVLDLASRVHVVADEELAKVPPDRRNAARVRMILTDGQVLERDLIFPRGSSHRPLGAEELRDKYRFLAGHALTVDRTEEIANVVGSLDDLADVSVLADLLASDR